MMATSEKAVGENLWGSTESEIVGRYTYRRRTQEEISQQGYLEF
jgi:glutamate/tyrosine decarboxylase-like PLP-dependent enzyme